VTELEGQIFGALDGAIIDYEGLIEVAFLNEVLAYALIHRSAIVRHYDGMGNILCPYCPGQSMPIEGPFPFLQWSVECFSPGEGGYSKNLQCKQDAAL
jgi:hypothetical protein